MKVDTELLDDLLRRMLEKGLSELEFRKGEQRVLLRLPTGENAQLKLPETVPVLARGIGVLRLAHPRRQDDAVAVGHNVIAGEIVGFLEAGMTLTPVRSPKDGVITSIDAYAGSLVSFGDMIMTVEAR